MSGRFCNMVPAPDASPFKDDPPRTHTKVEGETQEIIDLKMDYIGGRIGPDEFESKMAVLKSKL